MKELDRLSTYVCNTLSDREKLWSIERLKNARKTLRKSRSSSLVLGGYTDFGGHWLSSEQRAMCRDCVDTQDTLVCTEIMYHHEQIEKDFQ